jgi:esterase FrsA
MRGAFQFLRDRFLGVALLFIAVGGATTTVAQQPPAPSNERTIEEIKVEAVSRAENGQYPCIGQNPDDLKEAFEHIKTRDRDEWGAAFIAVGDRYMAEGKSLEKSDPAKADAAYIRAWRVYSFGRWPVPSSPQKQRSYEKALEAFRAHAKFWDPPMTLVHIPF